MQRTSIWIVPALGVLLGQVGCQTGGTEPFSCTVNEDCPPGCVCLFEEESAFGYMFSCGVPVSDSLAALCGGSCIDDTTCAEGTSCELEDRLIFEGRPNLWVFACLPDSGTGGSGGSGGTSGSSTTQARESPVPCAQPGDLVAIADAFVRGGTSAEEDYQNTSYGTRPNLTIKSVVDLRFSRKIYIVFDLLSAPSAFEKASLVLTLIRHIESPRDPENSSGPQPVDVYGIVDDNDWDPTTLAQDEITWIKAPRNNTSAGNAFEDSAGVPRLIPGYDFDLEGDEVMDEPGTKYALDITEYVRGRLENDADGKITILMAISTLEIDVEGSEFRSLDIPEGEMCDRPFLHFE